MADTLARHAQLAGPHVRGLASLAAALGIGAVTAAAACCVLPLALASIGAGIGLAGGLAALAAVRTPLLVLAAAILVAAWAIWWRRRETACGVNDTCPPSARSATPLVLLITATALIALAGAFPAIEPMLMTWAS